MNRTVISFNIERFRKLLETETDGDKRRTIIDLLAEEQRKMSALDGAGSPERNGAHRLCVKCGGELKVLTQSSRFRPPHDHVLTTYFECPRCIHIQIEDRVTPARDHLDDLLRLTMAEVGATRGHIQLLNRNTQTLMIAVQSGYDQTFLVQFHEVSAGDGTVTGRALQEQRRVVIDNVETSGLPAPMISIARNWDVASIHAIPLLGRDSRIAGMISTHFDRPHRPSADEIARINRHVAKAFEILP